VWEESDRGLLRFHPRNLALEGCRADTTSQVRIQGFSYVANNAPVEVHKDQVTGQ
jgi:hypothetical protein